MCSAARENAVWRASRERLGFRERQAAYSLLLTNYCPRSAANSTRASRSPETCTLCCVLRPVCCSVQSPILRSTVCCSLRFSLSLQPAHPLAIDPRRTRCRPRLRVLLSLQPLTQHERCLPGRCALCSGLYSILLDHRATPFCADSTSGNQQRPRQIHVLLTRPLNYGLACVVTRTPEQPPAPTAGLERPLIFKSAGAASPHHDGRVCAWVARQPQSVAPTVRLWSRLARQHLPEATPAECHDPATTKQ